MNIVISGHYGGINLGDDAILYSLVDTLRKICDDELDITAFSHDPKLTRKQTGVRSVKHVAFSSLTSVLKELKDVIQAIKLSDVVIIGGGGLLQDEFNIKTIPRYFFPAILGRLYRKKVVFYALGAGPLNTHYSKKLIRLLSAQADHITVRDKESKKTLKDLGVEGVEVIPDPAFRLPKCDKARTLQILQEEKIDSNRRPLIGVSLRGIYHTSKRKIQSMKELSAEQKNIIVKCLEGAAQQLGALLVFICTDNSMDKEISEEIAGRCSCDTRIITAKYPPAELAGVLGAMDLATSMPLHPLIIASSNYIPVLAIAYNPKVSNFMKLVELEKYSIPIERLDLLKENLLKIYDKRSDINKHLVKKINQLKEISIKKLDLMLHEGQETKKSRNLPLLAFSLIYMILGFIPEYFIHKYFKK